MTGTWNAQTQCLGAFIRNRRKLARLSLRQLAEKTSLSDPYLSQLERGLHLPSVRVLKLLSEALDVSAETLLAQVGLLDLASSGDGAAAADEPPASSVESAISADERLADQQKAALIAVYRSMLHPSAALRRCQDLACSGPARPHELLGLDRGYRTPRATGQPDRPPKLLSQPGPGR